MPRTRDRKFKGPRGPQFVARAPIVRDKVWEQRAKEQVLELLSQAPARQGDIARHLQLDDSAAHEVIRRLRDDDLVQSDGGYWVMGSRRR